jgi:hypothetical protein
VSGSGRRARRYFSRSGELRHIKRLRFWPLAAVLREKYELPDEEVGASCSHPASLYQVNLCTIYFSERRSRAKYKAAAEHRVMIWRRVQCVTVCHVVCLI